eukprot:TRINITY_DN384_c0_g1_i1.p1 TRINITY_DN384_c0_g1~~TRINITY_DN384_c0_g1_i1.p1  ORF type:complete len:97 (+),score=34.13 TRINITY_DN384_c0_g1_i1:134-424(+)
MGQKFCPSHSLQYAQTPFRSDHPQLVQGNSLLLTTRYTAMVRRISLLLTTSTRYIAMVRAGYDGLERSASMTAQKSSSACRSFAPAYSALIPLLRV